MTTATVGPTEGTIAAVEVTEITVERRFADFEEFWGTATVTASQRALLASLSPGDLEQLEARVRTRMTSDVAGPFVHRARANALKGRVPG